MLPALPANARDAPPPAVLLRRALGTPCAPQIGRDAPFSLRYAFITCRYCAHNITNSLGPCCPALVMLRTLAMGGASLGRTIQRSGGLLLSGLTSACCPHHRLASTFLTPSSPPSLVLLHHHRRVASPASTSPLARWFVRLALPTVLCAACLVHSASRNRPRLRCG